MDEKTQQNNTPTSGIKTIHTYTSDMADAVRENEASVIKIALAERDKREREEVYKEAEGTPATKLLLLLGGLILIGGTVVGGYFIYQKNQSTVAIEKPVSAISALIAYDDKVLIDVTNAKSEADIADAMKVDATKQGNPGSIKSLFLTRTLNGKNDFVPLDKLISTMNLSAPATLLRTLSGEYMVGTYTDIADQNANAQAPITRAHLFLILKVKDYNQAYAAMLTWEKTLLRDLFVIFNIDVSGDRSALFDKPWKDIILSNKDARILYDTSGNDVLFYEFPAKDTLIITDSKKAIREINLRLLSQTVKPL